ncbi:MAG: AsmA family protein, partial [Paludibacteraceae bacterium]|nr:AsmA family protein [Paludibacteraceae bacterium]
MKTFWKICGWGALVIVLLFALILAVASPAAKYVVNNYGEQIVGRQMHADRVIINPYWGGVTINGFECKEANGETNFVSFDRLYVHIAYPQLLGKIVKLRAIHLDGFDGQVLKHNDKVNFSDIIERFSKNDSVPADTAKSEWSVILEDIRINNSNIRYRDVVNDKQWKLEDLTLRIPGLYFDNTQTNAGIEFGLPTGGRVGIIAGMKLQSNRYAVKLNLHDVHTDVVLPLVQDYLDVTGLGAKMNGSLHVDGSLDVISNILLTGNLSLTGLSLRDSHKDEVAALDELRVAISKGDIAKNTFILDSLTINGLTANYEVHEGWTTLTRLMKSKEEVEADSTATDSIETPIEVQKPRATKPLVWMAKRVTLTGHDISYHDYSMKHNW